MNKIIIVGHSASGFLEVEAQLLGCGMKAPLPSRHEGILPKELTEILCKAHQTPPADILSIEEDFQQIEAGLVWHGLALDLLLGNLEQKLWGWADTQTIFLLNYWYSMDPQATFVLVYDEPQRVLVEASMRQNGALNDQEIQHLLDNWAAYNGAMLRFALRHPDRCLLVNAQQVGRAMDDYLTQLRARLSAPQQADDELLSINEAQSFEKQESDVALSESMSSDVPLAQVLHNALSIIGQSPGPALQTLREDWAECYLVEHYLAAYPQYLQFYQELQSAANMPLVDAQSNPTDINHAWQSLVNQRELFTNILGELYRRCHTFQVQNAQNEEACGLAVAQLHQVKEELESHHMENQRLLQRLSTHEEQSIASGLAVAQHHQVKEELESQLVAKDRICLDLAEQLQQSQIKISQLQQRNTKHTEENRRLVDHIERVKENCHSHYLENQRLLQRLSTDEEQSKIAITEQNQTIDKLTRDNQQLRMDTANRIKQQLSYRLGSTIVSRSQRLSGWLGMPYALYCEIKNFYRARQTR